MKNEELAFLNQQLASMLKEGIPLEGAIQQLCKTMRRGTLKQEFEMLESDLTKGIPLDQALDNRPKLPAFYKQMLRVGVKGNNLPATLTLVADHYHNFDSLKIRLKGLMVYPLILLIAAIMLSGSISFVLTDPLFVAFHSSLLGSNPPLSFFLYLWAFPVLFLLLLITVLSSLSIPPIRRRLVWWLPGFQETNLSQLASSIRILLAGGSNLDEAFLFVGHLENSSPAGKQLEDWHRQMASGHMKVEELSSKQQAIPPLFRWIVGNSGEDIEDGFKQAGELYSNRAKFKIDMLLQAALPISILALGLFIVAQFIPVMRLLTQVMDSI